MPDSRDPRAIDRRAFMQMTAAAAAAAAAGGLAPAASFAQSPVPSAPAPPAAPDAAAVISDDARALTAMLQRRFEGRLTAEQWEAVARDFESDLGVSKRLRAFPVMNADEPDSTFRV